MGFDGLKALVTEDHPSFERLGIWTSIAESLPLRSVKSCHNLAKRLFNPQNYKGHWTPDEEEKLIKFLFFSFYF